MRYGDILAFRIRQQCDERGITINGLASLSGLRQSTLANIMGGASQNPTLKTLHCIANTFNMTLSEFLDFPELNDYSLEDEVDG